MVILAAKILARVLVINGPDYVKKFAEKNGGIAIIKYRLKRWWNIPTVWPICFAILFGKDIAAIDFERTFDLYSLLESFAPKGDARAVYPEILPVVTAMLQSGLKSIAKDQGDPESPSNTGNDVGKSEAPKDLTLPTFMRRRSMSLNTELTPSGPWL